MDKVMKGNDRLQRSFAALDEDLAIMPKSRLIERRRIFALARLQVERRLHPAPLDAHPKCLQAQIVAPLEILGIEFPKTRRVTGRSDRVMTFRDTPIGLR